MPWRGSRFGSGRCNGRSHPLAGRPSFRPPTLPCRASHLAGSAGPEGNRRGYGGTRCRRADVDSFECIGRGARREVACGGVEKNEIVELYRSGLLSRFARITSTNANTLRRRLGPDLLLLIRPVAVAEQYTHMNTRGWSIPVPDLAHDQIVDPVSVDVRRRYPQSEMSQWEMVAVLVHLRVRSRNEQRSFSILGCLGLQGRPSSHRRPRQQCSNPEYRLDVWITGCACGETASAIPIKHRRIGSSKIPSHMRSARPSPSKSPIG